MPAYKLILPVITFPSATPLPPLKLPKKKAAAILPGKPAPMAAERIPPVDDPFAC